LAAVGYKSVIHSYLKSSLEDQPTDWKAKFDGENIPQCEIEVLSSSNNRFSITYIDAQCFEWVLYSAISPFQYMNRCDEEDVRVPILEELCKSFNNNDGEFEWLYRQVNKLWENQKMKFLTGYSF
jgi:hypothetical protein